MENGSQLQECCVVCSEVVIRRRPGSVPNNYGVLSCNACAAFFYGTLSGSKVYECLYSNKCNISSEYRRAHINTYCRSCRFEKCIAMGMKKQDVSDPKFKCDKCPKAYEKKSGLTVHNYQCHGVKSYPCKVDGCTKTFGSRSARNTHSNVKNPKFHMPGVKRSVLAEEKNQEGMFECLKCSLNNTKKTFSTRQAFNVHQRSFHDGKRFFCKIPGCNQVFTTADLRNHHSRNPKSFLHDPEYYRKRLKKKKEVELKKKLMIKTSFSGKENGKGVEGVALKQNSTSTPLKIDEECNSYLFTKKANFLISNGYLNQYLFAYKKRPDGLPIFDEKEIFEQQKVMKYQNFWNKIDKTKMDNECQRLLSLGKAAMCDSGVEAMEASTSIQQATPSTDPSLLENIAFKPITNCNVNGVELPEAWLWKAIHLALTDPAFLLNGMKFPLREVIQQLKWQVSPAHGVYEIFKSEVLVLKKQLPTVNGFSCSKCKEYGSKSLCTICYFGSIPTGLQPEKSMLTFSLNEAPRKTASQVFLVARISGTREPFNIPGVFQTLRRSIEQSAENPGPFNGFNFPGAPLPIIFRENFMSVASVTTAIDRMFERTSDPNLLPMHMLAEYIIFHYYPGNTITIGMTQPGSFTASPNYMKQFIEGLFSRGIPKDSLFFYCHCLKSTNRKSIKHETIVKANDLLKLIKKNSPTYGTRPAAVAYLNSMIAEFRKREDLPLPGRNLPDPTNYHSGSQDARKKLVYADLSRQICQATDCNVVLGRNFSIKCGDCSRWYHGSCVGIQRQHARVLEEKGLQLSCHFCLEDEAEVHSTSSQPSTEGVEDVDMD